MTRWKDRERKREKETHQHTYEYQAAYLVEVVKKRALPPID